MRKQVCGLLAALALATAYAQTSPTLNVLQASLEQDRSTLVANFAVIVERAAPLDLNGISGTLDTSDPVLASGRHIDAYRFDGRAGQAVTLELVKDPDTPGSQLDPVLVLIGSHLALLSDDIDRNNVNSRLIVTLPADGAYLVIATSFFDDRLGAYRLTIAVQEPPSPEAPPSESVSPAPEMLAETPPAAETARPSSPAPETPAQAMPLEALPASPAPETPPPEQAPPGIVPPEFLQRLAAQVGGLDEVVAGAQLEGLEQLVEQARLAATPAELAPVVSQLATAVAGLRDIVAPRLLEPLQATVASLQALLPPALPLAGVAPLVEQLDSELAQLARVVAGPRLELLHAARTQLAQATTLAELAAGGTSLQDAINQLRDLLAARLIAPLEGIFAAVEALEQKLSFPAEAVQALLPRLNSAIDQLAEVLAPARVELLQAALAQLQAAEDLDDLLAASSALSTALETLRDLVVPPLLVEPEAILNELEALAITSG
ncbi:MAG: hypothetical protein HY335_05930 [Deinococcus sp.]|nr:hypothetical protein [Deinococcus sp.]